MDNKKLSSMEIDAIGEILNISLGASATAISSMLDARVDITTPVVQIQTKDEFKFNHLEPAVGVEIVYVEGLTGSNIMLLKRSDVRVIVEMLMGTEIAEEDFELDEMNISAICEVMNQMMGASATALSELLGRTVNISTPESFEITSPKQFKDKYFQDDGVMTVIGFTIQIADRLKSEFMNLMPIGLARELVAGFFADGVPDVVDEPDIESPADIPVQEPDKEESANVPVQEQEQTQESEISSPDISGEMPAEELKNTESANDMMNLMQRQMEAQQLQMQQIQQMLQMQQDGSPKKIGVKPAPRPNLTEGMGAQPDREEEEANMELIMGVPLDVSVEIGRTRKLVKDILELNKGSLVVLDKLAGEQVDLFVNGQCIAKGDVVVVDDNFGIRITEILKDEITLLE